MSAMRAFILRVAPKAWAQDMEAESRQWMMRCDRARLRVAITLAPTIPAKVQYLNVRRADPDESLAAPAVCPLSKAR